MTDLMPNSSLTLDHQRLLELIEAEDAANGEVGCGRDWGSKLPIYLQTCHLNVSDTAFRELLREHLGHVLMERDFDRIVEGVLYFIEPIVVEAHLQTPVSAERQREATPEYIPTEQLKARFQQDLGGICSSGQIDRVVHFAHQAIHRAVLNPRHTWLPSIWVLTNGKDFYVVQSANPDCAIAQVQQQYPDETAPLRAVKANNIVAPTQAIKIEVL
jgi:hypothetical protein